MKQVLLGQDQFAVTGHAQAIVFAVVFDNDFILRGEQLPAAYFGAARVLVTTFPAIKAFRGLFAE
jgi:hypothetical protein